MTTARTILRSRVQVTAEQRQRFAVFVTRVGMVRAIAALKTSPTTLHDACSPGATTRVTTLERLLAELDANTIDVAV